MTSMSVGGYWPSPLEARIRDAASCEMEAGVLLTLAGLFGVRAGADRTPWPGVGVLDHN
jgi:hypothetical protein